MKINIKKLHPDAIIPSYAKEGDAALDLTAVSMTSDPFRNIVYGTGLSLEIPDGYVGLLYPRSSVSKTGLSLANSVGVIDSGYRGEIILKYRFNKNLKIAYNNSPQVGDRVGQLMIVPRPKVELIEVEELSNSDRGVGGFGSTGS
jgi:dUTP pyrophosphatase